MSDRDATRGECAFASNPVQRHCFCPQGESIVYVKEQLGHASIQICSATLMGRLRLLLALVLFIATARTVSEPDRG